MKVFNLYDGDLDNSTEREGWNVRAAKVGECIGGELIMFGRPGPELDYWEGEE